MARYTLRINTKDKELVIMDSDMPFQSFHVGDTIDSLTLKDILKRKYPITSVSHVISMENDSRLVKTHLVIVVIDKG